MDDMSEKFREKRGEMGRHWLRLTAAAAAVASITAATGALARREVPHVPEPGYTCTVGDSLGGEVWGERVLDETGKQISASVEWQPRGGDVWQPRVFSLWMTQSSSPLRAEDGSFVMSWSLKDEVRKRRSQVLTMELTTEARARPWPRALLMSRPDKSTDGRLEGAWSDMLALARGARALFAVMRDERGAIVAQAGIDPALFTRGGRMFADTQGEMEAIVNDFHRRCTHVDDLNPDIVVT